MIMIEQFYSYYILGRPYTSVDLKQRHMPFKQFRSTWYRHYYLIITSYFIFHTERVPFDFSRESQHFSCYRIYNGRKFDRCVFDITVTYTGYTKPHMRWVRTGFKSRVSLFGLRLWPILRSKS